jgi:hypothetical protein
MLLFPNMEHLEVSITRSISHLYRSDGRIDECEEEIVGNNESDRHENYDAECLFCTSDVCIW